VTGHKERIVYGDPGDDQVMFLREQEALELAQLWDAIAQAKTWGEVKRLLPDRWQEVVEHLGPRHQEELGRDYDEPPADEDPFDDPRLVFWEPIIDSNWPIHAGRRMYEWLPKHIQELGNRTDIDIVQFDIWDEAVAAFEQEGYTCVHDDHLIFRACGYGVL
jgi:hypothetical protein